MTQIGSTDQVLVALLCSACDADRATELATDVAERIRPQLGPCASTIASVSVVEVRDEMSRMMRAAGYNDKRDCFFQLCIRGALGAYPSSRYVRVRARAGTEALTHSESSCLPLYLQVWRRPADSRCSVHLRVRYSSLVIGLSARKVNGIHEELCMLITATLGMPIRRRADALPQAGSTEPGAP